VRRGGVGVAGDGAWHSSKHVTARHGMGAPPLGSLGRADSAASHNEQSEKLGIFVGCRRVDGVDRGEILDGSVVRSLC
jgi:hypothetical protein